ncbi:MAG: LysM peptidoglycan-binding domain-containing protein [Spirochaetaceae bacterium]|nr:LysM peptidoglycan-binding domain-containing protein [Spirochaetaceae bacterium]
MKLLLLFALICMASFNAQAQLQHRLERGETLFSLSRRFNVSVADIMQSNNLTRVDNLPVGLLLTIPQNQNNNNQTVPGNSTLPATYLVNRGDTYFSIARNFNITVTELLALLGRTASTPLRAGEVLHFNRQNNQPHNTAALSPPITPPVTPNQQPAVPPVTTAVPPPITVTPPPNNNNNNNNTPATTRPNATLPVVNGLTWPASGPVSPNNGVQGGVRIAVNGQSPILSLVAGTVMYTGIYRELGHVVLILHHDTNYFYVYSGFDTVLVSIGDNVQSGTILGNTSRSRDIFFSVFNNGVFIDPHLAPRA